MEFLCDVACQSLITGMCAGVTVTDLDAFFCKYAYTTRSASLIKYRHQIEITMTAKNVPAEMLLGAVYGINICAIPQPCSHVVDPIVSFVCKIFSKCDFVGATDNINVLPLFACDAKNKPKMNEQIKNKISIDDGHLISVSLVYELSSYCDYFGCKGKMKFIHFYISDKIEWPLTANLRLRISLRGLHFRQEASEYLFLFTSASHLRRIHSLLLSVLCM